jgi:putative flippase GtrA
LADRVNCTEPNQPSDGPPTPAFNQAGFFVLSRSLAKGTGRKRRFGIAGLLNVAITNLVLQCLLASSTVSTLLATLIGQVINTALGYAIYGKLVFRAKGLSHHKPALKYLSLMTAIWLLNSMTINVASSIGIARSLTAAAMIPVLAVVSYLVQKSWVFR